MPFACAASAVKAPASGRTILSAPPSPPSTVPATEPPAAKTKVSLLFAAPWRFSTFAKVTPATVPLPAPVTVHVASDEGPTSVSFPAPPSNVTASGTTAVVSIAITSSPSLPAISSDVTSMRLTASAAPEAASTSSAEPSSKSSLWFHPLPSCGEALALPLVTCHTVEATLGFTTVAAGVVSAAVVVDGATVAAVAAELVVAAAGALVAALVSAEVVALESVLAGVDASALDGVAGDVVAADVVVATGAVAADVGATDEAAGAAGDVVLASR